MHIAGIITAAGLSSRMGEFKPLLTLNGLPMALHTVLSMKNAGISPICVVTGYRGDELKAALADSGVIFAENPDPKNSDMLESIRLGLKTVSDSDGFFLLPADMPLTAPETFSRVMECAKDGSNYIVPAVNGKRSHPPLIMSACYDAIFNFTGAGGLPAALAEFTPRIIEAGDYISNMDADFPDEFSEIEKYAGRRLGASDEVCAQLWDKAELAENIIAHCKSVGELSGFIAEKLNSRGYCLDVLMCRSAGMLHDIMRTHKGHSAAGADFLEGEGLYGIADIVRHHMTFDGLGTDFDEHTVVCLADKLIFGTSRVSPFERYAPASEKYPSATEIGGRVRRDCVRAFSLYAKFVDLTGESLY